MPAGCPQTSLYFIVPVVLDALIPLSEPLDVMILFIIIGDAWLSYCMPPFSLKLIVLFVITGARLTILMPAPARFFDDEVVSYYWVAVPVNADACTVG